MSYDWEHQLISKILYEGDLIPAIEAKISPAFFHDHEHRRAWDYICDAWAKHGKVPTSKAFKTSYPNYHLFKVEDPYELILDELRARRRLEIAIESAASANEALQDEDVDGYLEAVNRGLLDLHTQVTHLRDIDLMTTTEARMRRYEAAKERTDDLIGLPTGFKIIDRATLGLQPEQLVTLIALPKRGKSLIMLAMALAAHDAGKTPLFVTFEMTAEEQAERLDALWAEVSLSKLRAGKLSPKQENKLKVAYAAMKKGTRPPFLVSSDIDSATTVGGVRAKVEQYTPDVVFIDGVYLMDDERGEEPGTPKALTNITRGLKRLAQSKRVPLVCSTQVLPWKYSKKQGLNMGGIGYTSSFAQDSDVILGVDNQDDDGEFKVLQVVESRNCGKVEVSFRVEWDALKIVETHETPAVGVGSDSTYA